MKKSVVEGFQIKIEARMEGEIAKFPLETE